MQHQTLKEEILSMFARFNSKIAKIPLMQAKLEWINGFSLLSLEGL
jgi:hypothetical protein